jgi:hypothetical protein
VSTSLRAEGMRIARLLLVLSSVSPLFILWALRGSTLIPDPLLVSVCTLAVLLPNAFLWLRIRTAVKQRVTRELVVGRAEDHRDHLLVYLFAMLLPLYAADLSTWRELTAALFALVFIVFLFWHLNLHYMNLAFAVRGLHVFTVYPPEDGNPNSGRGELVLITPRAVLSKGDTIRAYRISDKVLMETANGA